MERETIIRGKAWVITDYKGNPIKDIDTDMIYHNKYIGITDINEMGKYAFGNLSNWEDFPLKAKEGDIIVTGEGFGQGSSRQQAVDCFISLGISAIVGESFAPIYLRNAINAGLLIIACPTITSNVITSDILEIDLENGIIKNLSSNKTLSFKKPHEIQMEIYRAGGLLRL